MFPVLFHIGSFAVHTYGVLLMLAFVVAIGRASARARQHPELGLKPDDVLDLGLWILGAGVLGARLLFVILEWTSYRLHPESALKIWEGGLSFHGGLAGGFLAALVFCRRRKIPFLHMADLYAPSAMIGYVIGRVGCFFNGCCYGAACDLPWAVRFDDAGHLTPPSHPTQLYAAALGLLFFAVLVKMEKRKTFDGQLFFAYILFSAVERFIMEIWRVGTTSSALIHGLTDVQWLCVALGGIAGFGLANRRGRAPKLETVHSTK